MTSAIGTVQGTYDRTLTINQIEDGTRVIVRGMQVWPLDLFTELAAATTFTRGEILSAHVELSRAICPLTNERFRRAVLAAHKYQVPIARAALVLKEAQ